MSSKHSKKTNMTFGDKLLKDYADGSYKITDEELAHVRQTKEELNVFRKQAKIFPITNPITSPCDLECTILRNTVYEAVENALRTDSQIILEIDSKYTVTRIGNKNTCRLNKNEVALMRLLSNNKSYIKTKDIVASDVGYTTPQSVQKAKAKLDKKLTQDLDLDNSVISSSKSTGYTINNLYEIKFVK